MSGGSPARAFNLYLKASSGEGTDELLLETPNNKSPLHWSKDGQFLLYGETSPKTGRDLWVLEMIGKERVFGPKIVATRGPFEDRALESRCLTEEMGQYRLREDIRINLPAEHKEEALRIRNKLLLFRFRNMKTRKASEALVDRSVEPRLNQIFVPLLSIIEDPQAREDLRELARKYNREMIADRGLDMEAQILEIIRDMLASPFETRLSIKDITSWFIDRHGNDYEKKITTKWIGWLIRKKLNVKTHRSHGLYVIPLSEKPKLERLYERYGIEPKEAENADSEEPQFQSPIS